MDDETTAEPAEGTVGEGGEWQPVPDEVEDVPPAEDDPNKKSVDEIAQEVIAGRWGRGNARKKKLADAGYDIYEINSQIAKIINR